MQKIFVLILIGATLVSCSRKNDEDLFIPGNMLLNGSFEDASLLDELWEPDGEGYALFDNTDFYEGEKCLLIGAEDCRSMVYEELLQVEEDKKYELSFAVKMPGIVTDCASQFAVSIYQGDKELLYFNITSATATEWNKQSYYLQTETDEPLTLQLIVGMDALLLDDMQLKEAVDL